MMQTTKAGVSFRETMSGSVSLNTSQPPQTATLSMHAGIRINDIRAFVADPRHQGGLGGSIDYPPLGSALPSESGVFGLFTPSGDPKMVYMVYELGFRHQGQAYYLAGKKHVRCGALWNLWSETTTLYVTLHFGSDASGPAIGQGILRLGILALLKMALTLRATNAGSIGGGIAAVACFLGFFAKELVRTYILQKPLPSAS